MRAILRDTPPHLAEVDDLIGDCDLDAPFTFGLELMLTGLRARQPE